MQNSQTAELARGLCFEERFTPESIAANKGVVTGTLGWDQDKGAYFDGTNDYIQYAVRIPAAGPALSVVVEFTPTVAAADDTNNYFFDFDTATAGRTYLYKSNDAASNLLYLYGGNSVMCMGVALAGYEPYWKTNQRNVLVATIATGAQNLRLNGTSVGNTAAALTFPSVARLTIGARYDGTMKFSGWIKSIKFFRGSVAADLLTSQEAIDYTNNSVFNYRSKAVVDLPMGAAQHDATNLKTLDVSPGGRHFTWTAGATAPTKLATVGYSSDGGDTLSSSAVVANATYTVALVVKHSSVTGYLADWRGGGGTGYVRLGSGILLEVSSGTAYVNGKPSTTLGKGCLNVVVVTGIALNGPAGTKLLADNAGANGMTGSMHRYGLWSGTLTPLQVWDLRAKILGSINAVG